MPQQLHFRYPLDPTGINLDNAVFGEVHTLSVAPEVRALAPTYGPFFSESVALFDHITNQPLIRGQDYYIVEILQDATMKFGKEIASLILITNRAINAEVRVNYQVLGGLYQNDSSSIVSMYETVMLDNRPVDWKNVFRKPVEYPPTLHRHLLEDVYGFEPVVIALERIRNAIVLSDVPAFEALIDWVNSRITANLTYQEIDDSIPVDKFVTFEKLLYALDKLNFNGITLNPTIATLRRKKNLDFNLSLTNWIDNKPLYWTIEHITTQASDFGTTSGIVNIVGHRGKFNISALDTEEVNLESLLFSVYIRKNSTTGPVMAKTSLLKLESNLGSGNMIDFMNSCCMYQPRLEINPTSYYAVNGFN